ncbi:DUF397 domain-containing protein [Nocardia sp. KC 131]|uniref:DUF397 domain-containing protein n=1 Tax=Nocardia arseniciresistens TaxID=3392119 RepID=UPI00398F13BD
MSGTRWFKSSYSNDSQTCVEVRFEGDRILVRDSKYQGLPDARPTLEFEGAEWTAFTATIRAASFPPA